MIGAMPNDENPLSDPPAYVDAISGERYPISAPRWRADTGAPLMIMPLAGIGRDMIDALARDHIAVARRLPDLKRTRKIFFVGNWLTAFVGGQPGEGALADVEAFLRRSDVDADLRLKVLEAIDGLERAVRIRKK